MYKIIWKSFFILAVVFALNVQAQEKNTQAVSQDQHRTVNTATIPVPKLEEDFYDWYKRHEQVKELIKKQPVDIVFIGDSITHMFGGLPVSPIVHGGKVWDKYYGRRNVVNMGFGWDRTQNVLWRLENGEFEGIKPKVAVILIGTNNLTGTENARENTPVEIAEGVYTICKIIHHKVPGCKILLLGVLPRSPERFVKLIREINELLSKLDSEDYITFLNFGNLIADNNGLPRKGFMFEDGVHPNEKGYQIWAETMEPLLKKMISDE